MSYSYSYIFQVRQFGLPDQKEIVLRKRRIPKDHLLAKCLNIKCPINTFSENAHTVTLNILLMMQENFQSICKELDVLENVLYFTMENSIKYLPLQSGIYVVCLRANNSVRSHPRPPQYQVVVDA